MLLDPTQLLACSCGKSSLETDIKRYDNIFVARITAAKEVWVKGIGHVQGDFQLTETLKGSAKGIESLKTGIYDGDCGVPFRVGHYLLAFTGNTGHISLCSSSEELGVGFNDLYKHNEVYIATLALLNPDHTNSYNKKSLSTATSGDKP